MSSGMNVEQAKEYAKTMTYLEAVSNVRYSKGIKYRKATMIKLRELAEIADRLDRKTENCSEIPNNCEWSVEYAKEMLDTMSCEECGHWEHGAHNHYYCALLEMRQECYFESKDESTLMFANKPKDEPQTDCAWK